MDRDLIGWTSDHPRHRGRSQLGRASSLWSGELLQTKIGGVSRSRDLLMTTDRPFPWIEFGVSIGTWDLVDYAYPDTGFEGGLLIPAGVGREIVASPDRVPLCLADGAIVQLPCLTGTL